METISPVSFCRRDWKYFLRWLYTTEMVIDGRWIESRELLIKLREIFAQHSNREISLEVLLMTMQDAKRAKAFVSMCGLETKIEEQEGHYLLKISGVSCRCGF